MLSKDELQANNDRFWTTFAGSQLGSAPVRKLLVLTCMDARMDPLRVLGLQDGDAHVIRNAGGRVPMTRSAQSLFRNNFWEPATWWLCTIQSVVYSTSRTTSCVSD